jgi:hypothetical protein
MNRTKLTRRDFLTNAATSGLAACALPVLAADTATEAPADQAAAGSQRLPLGQLRKWEALQYGGKRGQEPFPTRSGKKGSGTFSDPFEGLAFMAGKGS